ncbi:MAG: DNA polymerase Y family protein [Acidobacteriaceae bacterium]
MKTQYACIHVREFPLQAMLRLRPELLSKPVAVLDGEPPFEQVCSRNDRALALGITHGMTKLDLEMFSAAVILPRARAEEAAARTALLQCAGTFSPRIEDLSSGNIFTCVIDITGTEKLFGSPEVLGESLQKKIKALGVQTSIAISSKFHAARCLACGHSGGEIRVIPQGKEAAALASLPLSVLALSPQHEETFAMWGIASLGDLGKLSETELITRLGQAGKELRLMARGESPHLFAPIEESFLLLEQMELDSPVELLDSLLFILRVMLDQLIVRAQSSILALAEITLTLNLEGGISHARTVRPALPNNDLQLWLKLIHLDLQAHPPQAAITSLSLNAQPGSTSKMQLGLFSPQQPESMQLDVTLARIRSIVGDGRVGKAVLNDTHRPDAFSMEPFVLPPAYASQSGPQTRRVALRQIRPPEAVAVTLLNRQPNTFIFRERQYFVEHAYGPWASSGDWWNPTLWSVEQWDLVARGTDTASPGASPGARLGTRLCCCLTQDLIADRWQLEALYD